MKSGRIAALGLALVALSAGVVFHWGSYQHDIHLIEVDNPAGPAARLPRFSQTASGLLMSWVESGKTHDLHSLKFALFENGRWTQPGEVYRGERWFVNWSDFPSVTAIDSRFWAAHWLVKKAGGGTYDYDIAMAYSRDTGANWQLAGPPHRDGVSAEHGFAVIFPVANKAGVVWLDGRDYVEEKDRHRHPDKSGNFTLRYTTLDRNGQFTEEEVIDHNTCTCCWPAIAVTPEGVVAAWRGRTDDEIRDNRYSILLNGQWLKPLPLGAEGWEIQGCPVNGPALAARGKQVVAAWFTAQGDRPRVRAAFSHDGGRHFGAPLEIDDDAPLGRIGLVWRDDDAAVISWMTASDARTRQSSIALRVLHTNGRLGPKMRAVSVSAGRDTGVPQMVSIADGLLLAWTGEAPNYGIHTALVKWEQLRGADASIWDWFPRGTWLGGLESRGRHH